MSNLPSGTVTFLFTDIEGSTKLWESVPEKMKVALQRHHEILNSAIESNGGVVFQIIGDAFCAAFHTAIDALHAAVKSQTDLHNEDWGETVAVKALNPEVSSRDPSLLERFLRERNDPHVRCDE